MKEYAVATFQDPLLSDQAFDQLSWAVGGEGHTPEKAFQVSESMDYIEVRRCLSRIYCMQLLQSEDNYEKFIEPQVKDDLYCPPLTLEQYHRLVAKFKTWDPLAREVLKVSTIISSVSLRPITRQRADQVLGKNNYTFDSVEFLADTFKNIDNAKKIYPLVYQLFQQFPEKADQDRITKLLQSAFSSKQHYRHMLYTEGSQGMFENLLHAVQKNKDREVYDFWIGFWTINITGFRGQVKAKGSLYLTSNTFKAMTALESSLEKMWNEPHCTANKILNHYLDIRAGEDFIRLARENLEAKFDQDDRRMLAHIACMMRLFHPDEGEALFEGYRLIPKSRLKKLQAIYFNYPSELPTPTYAPAMYENGLDYRKKQLANEDAVLRKIQETFISPNIKLKAEQLKRLVAIADVVVGVLPVELAALECHRDLFNEKKIAANQPITFKNLADKNAILECLSKSPILRQFNVLNKMSVEIDVTGVVSFEPRKVPVIQHQYDLRRKQKEIQVELHESPKEKIKASVG